MTSSSQAPKLAEVVIVAGNTAYPEYLEYQAYVGHPDRPFHEQCRGMAFYKSQVIQPEVPEILDIRHGLTFSDETIKKLYESGNAEDRDVADLVQVLLEETDRKPGALFDVVLLSGPDDPRTFTLDNPITNTKKDHKGNPTPVTMGQYRYTSLELLKEHPSTTDQLSL